jgi:Na+/phosphate symporter
MHDAKKFPVKRAKQFVSQHILLNMFNALVLTHFTHCSNVWRMVVPAFAP